MGFILGDDFDTSCGDDIMRMVVALAVCVVVLKKVVHLLQT